MSVLISYFVVQVEAMLYKQLGIFPFCVVVCCLFCGVTLITTLLCLGTAAGSKRSDKNKPLLSQGLWCTVCNSDLLLCDSQLKLWLFLNFNSCHTFLNRLTFFRQESQNSFELLVSSYYTRHERLRFIFFYTIPHFKKKANQLTVPPIPSCFVH